MRCGVAQRNSHFVHILNKLSFNPSLSQEMLSVSPILPPRGQRFLSAPAALHAQLDQLVTYVSKRTFVMPCCILQDKRSFRCLAAFIIHATSCNKLLSCGIMVTHSVPLVNLMYIKSSSYEQQIYELSEIRAFEKFKRAEIQNLATFDLADATRCGVEELALWA